MPVAATRDFSIALRKGAAACSVMGGASTIMGIARWQPLDSAGRTGLAFRSGRCAILGIEAYT